MEPAARGGENRATRLQTYADLLAHSLVVGEARRALLDGLNKLTGQDFQGDIWQFVSWATDPKTGGKDGIKLKSRPD